MVPQPDNNSVIMHITYTLFDDGVSLGQVTMTAQTPIGGWAPGKFYTYSIEIEEITKELQLTVSVKPWHQPKDTGVKVPEPNFESSLPAATGVLVRCMREYPN